jgi:pimeloyl-ACP methyl ester carboxylesterase
MEERVQIKNRRGLHLAAVIHRPDRAEKGPCVLLLHGFLGCKEEEHIQAFAHALCALGIAAIRFDASGFHESEGTPEDDFRVCNYLTDVEDIFAYLRLLSFVDATRIGIAGHSLGAMLALIFTAMNPEIKACCAIQVPNKLTRKDSTIDFDHWRQCGWFEQYCGEPINRQIRLPYAMAEDADRFDALDYMAKIKVPLSILYGTLDQAVKPSNTILLYEVAHNCPKELIELEGTDHDFRWHPDKLRIVVDHVTNFFSANLEVRAPV